MISRSIPQDSLVSIYLTVNGYPLALGLPLFFFPANHLRLSQGRHQRLSSNHIAEP